MCFDKDSTAQIKGVDISYLRYRKRQVFVMGKKHPSSFSLFAPHYPEVYMNFFVQKI